MADPGDTASNVGLRPGSSATLARMRRSDRDGSSSLERRLDERDRELMEQRDE
jgi:hypothetical protein